MNPVFFDEPATSATTDPGDKNAEIARLKTETSRLARRVKDLENRMHIADVVLTGAPVYEMWQVAPVGSDTEIGQAYWAIKRPNKTEEP